MANRYAVAAGGVWTADATWSTTDGGAPDTVAPTASDDVFLTGNSGNVTISATSVGKSLDCTGYTGTLTHGAFSLTISGNVLFVAGMTYTPTASTANLRIANGTFTSAGKLLWQVTAITSDTLTLGDNLSFVAQKTAIFNAVRAVNLAGFTISGNSATNRVLVNSATLGTASGTVTLNGGTFANADFRDITLSASADLSAITGLSGDCGGNTNITFTTAATQTYAGDTGSWSDVTKWTSRVPLPQDNVLMSGVTGGTITADMPRLGKSIDWTGASGSPTFSSSISNTYYGSLTYISAMTWSGSTTVLEGRGSFTLTNAGKTFTGLTVQMVGGTLNLQDALSCSAQSSLEQGTFNTNGFGLTFGATFFSPVGSNLTRAFNITNSTLTFTGAGNTIGLASTSMTFTSSGSTIVLSNTSASSKTFAGGGLTYNNLHISGGGAGAVIITGANSFNQIRISGGTKNITLPGSTTTTINDGGGLGNETNVITFTASAGNATVSKPTGILGWDYVSLTNIPSTGGATFYAGANSTDGGGNTGWIFANAPSSGAFGGPTSAILYTQGWT